MLLCQPMIAEEITLSKRDSANLKDLQNLASNLEGQSALSRLVGDNKTIHNYFKKNVQTFKISKNSTTNPEGNYYNVQVR